MATFTDIYRLPREEVKPSALATAAPALIAAVVVALSLLPRPIDPDVWWHLRTGQIIFERGYLPDTPILSTSTAPWLLHEWLTEVVLWVGYDLGGWPLLGVGVAAAVAVAWAGLVAMHRDTGGQAVAMWLAIVAAVASAPVLGVRVQMVTLVLFSVYLIVLEHWRKKEGKADPLYLLALAVGMGAWGNMHGGFVLGLLVMAIYSAAELWRGRVSLASGTALAALCSLVNPYGVKLWLYPFQTLGSDTMRQYIAEWLPPTPHMLQWWPFFFLAAVVVAICGRFWEKMPLEHRLILLGATSAAFFSLRHVPLAAVAAVALLPPHWPARWRLPRPTSAHALVLLFSASLLAPHLLGQMVASEEGNYPTAAVEYLASHGAGPVPIFNEYGWGGYLVWHGFTPAIDGRADVYGQRVASTALARRGRAGWQAELEGYDLALLSPTTPLGQLLPLVGWSLVWEDDRAQIWRRP